MRCLSRTSRHRETAAAKDRPNDVLFKYQIRSYVDTPNNDHFAPDQKMKIQINIVLDPIYVDNHRFLKILIKT